MEKNLIFDELKKREKNIKGEAVDWGETTDVQGEEKDKSQNLFNCFPRGLFLYRLAPDNSLILQDANQTAEKILGVSCQEIRGKTIENVFSFLSDIEAFEKYRKVASEGNILETEQIYCSEDEIRRAFKVLAFQTKPNEMVCLFEDITEREQEKETLQTQLRQAQRMAAIGRLTSSIAHDFNNILATIFGFTELAIEHSEKGSSLHYWLQEVLTGAKRARDLIRQVLDLKRRSEKDVKPDQKKYDAK